MYSVIEKIKIALTREKFAVFKDVLTLQY